MVLGGLSLLPGVMTCRAFPLGEALGATNAVWRTGGDAPWLVDTNTLHGGLASIRSGAVSNGQESWVEVEVEGPANLNAAGRGEVGIMLNCDHSGLTGSLDVGSPWSVQVLSLRGASNVVRWTHRGEGATWLDKVKIIPDTNASPSKRSDLVISCGGAIHVESLAGAGTLALYAGSIVSSSGSINGVALPSGTVHGGVVINGVNLSLISNEVLLASKGTYTGLFLGTNDIGPDGSGFFSARTTLRGAYSAKVRLAGKTLSFTGRFDGTGKATNLVRRGQAPPLQIEFWRELYNPDRLVGTISDGVWTADLLAHRAVFRASGDPPCPCVGQYTLAIAGIYLGETRVGYDPMKAGHGYATLKVDGRGNIHCHGSLADGTRFTQSVPLSGDLEWPFFATCRRLGLVLGRITFADQPGSDLQGAVYWYRPPSTSHLIFAPDNELQAVVGSRYEFPADGSPVLDWREPSPPPASQTTALPGRMTMFPGTAEFAHGNLAAPFANNVALRADNKFVNLSDNALRLKLIKSTGRFIGLVVPPGADKPIRFQGVLVQKINAGGGYFLQDHSSGSIVLWGTDR